MNKMFIKMLTVSALSLTMLFGASFASSEDMTSLNMTMPVEEGHDFIVIEGSEYISTGKLAQIGVEVVEDNLKVIVGSNAKTYRVASFDMGEALKVNNKIYVPFKEVMSDNEISYEYTSSETMLVRYGSETFALFVKNENRPSNEVKANKVYNYVKIEDKAKKVDNLTEAMKIEIAKKIADEKAYYEKIKAENLTEAMKIKLEEEMKAENLSEAAKIDLEKKIKAEKLALAKKIAEESAQDKVVKKDSLVKFQNTVYIYSKELRNLNVETSKSDAGITVLNTKNDLAIDLTIKDVMYRAGQGGSDCLLPATRVLDELEIDYTIDFVNAKIEVRNAEGNVYYTFE